jgi:hypothetical protein
MAWRSGLTRSNLRGFAGLCALTLLGGLIVDTPHASASQQAFDSQLSYSCEFVNGPQPVGVRVQGRLPLRVTADSPVQPEQIQVAVNIAPAVLKGLSGLGSGPVTGSIQFNTRVAQGKQSGIVRWPKFVAAPATPDLTRGLTLTVSGTVPPINGAKAGSGPLSVAAGDFALSLAPQQGTKAGIAAGSKQSLCQPAQQKATTLGKVAVAARAAPNAAAASPTECPAPFPSALNPALPSATPTPGDAVTTNSAVPTLCAQAEGTSNAAKLHTGAHVSGIATIEFPYITVAPIDTSDPKFRADAAASLHFDPTRATFLGFGFMPVSATVRLIPIGNANGVYHGTSVTSFPPPKATTDIYANVDLQLSNASVNGVKLNLGSRCHITRPISLHLQGVSDSNPPYIVDQSGGPLTGLFTIPSFRNCGVGDNLDPLLNSTVAGPNNFARAYQGFPCLYGQTPERCPPRKPGIAVTPGGKWSGSGGSPVITVSGEIPVFQYDCSGLAISGSFKPGRNFWFGIGSLDKFDLSSCVEDPNDPPNPFSGTATLTSVSLPWALDVSLVHEVAPGVDRGQIRYGRIVYSVGDECTVIFSSENQNSSTYFTDASSWTYTYDESTGNVDFGTMGLNPVAVDKCEVDGVPQFIVGDPSFNVINSMAGTVVVPTAPLQKFSQ